MTFLDHIKGLFGISMGTPGAETWQEAEDWKRGLFFPGGDDGLLTDPYSNHPIIATALSIIAEDAASVPLELVRGEGEDAEVVESHPIIDLLSQPANNLSRKQLLTASYLHWLLHGEWFWEFEGWTQARPNASQRVRQMSSARIQLLDPRRVVHKIRDGEVVWALDEGTGTPRQLDAEVIFQHRRMNPYDEHRGLSPVQALETELAGDNAAARWNKNYFGEKNGIPSGLLKPGVGQNLDRDQRSEALDAWNQSKALAKRGIGLLPGGWEFQDLGVSQREMDFRSLREYSREIALGLLGVPPFMAGVLDKANYANARKQEEVYWQGTQKRFLGGVEDALNNLWLPKLGVADVLFRFNWESVNALTEDYAEKITAGNKLWQMGVPLEQVSARVGLKIDTADLPHAKESYLPYNLVPVGTPTVMYQQPDSGEAEPPVEEDPADDTGKGIREKASGRTIVWRQLTNQTRDLESRFSKTARGHFHNLEREALAAAGGTKGLAMVRVANKGEEYDGPDQLIDWNKADADLKKSTRPQYAAAMKRGGESVSIEIGIAEPFLLDSPLAVAQMLTLMRRIPTINATVRKQLQTAIAGALGTPGGTSVEQVKDAIREVFDVSKGRARTIARTEVGVAFGGGRFTQMKEAGIEEIEWLSAKDPDVRDSHENMDGTRIRIGAAFSNGLRYPKDPSGSAGEVINCRCVALPVKVAE